MSTTKMVNNFNAKEFRNFLTSDEVFEILKFTKETDLWNDSGHEFWKNRTINAIDVFLQNPIFGTKLFYIKKRIVKTIKDAYGIDEIYPDLLQITRWFDGMQQVPHSDNMMDTEHAKFHEHRAYGVVIYLNDDFDGGRTFYPQHNIEIVPEPGKMAVHPATVDHMHGVSPICGNTRYTLTTFLTFDKSKNMHDPINSFE